MDISVTPEDSYLESLEVESSTSSSIQVQWQVQGATVAFIDGFRVHYQKVASTYIQYGPKLPATATVYQIQNLVADTYYKVCLVTYRNDTNPLRQCVDASTTNWQLPVSIGSSIGAILALSIIVLIVLLSRCQIPYRYRKKIKTEPGRYDAMSSNYHDEQFDFSETVTQGNEDDYTSEMDPDDSGLYELSHNDKKYPRRPGERYSCANGNVRTPINPHAHLLNQKRHSLGRIHIHGHSGHHNKPVRAFSIQTEHPCSPLAKESPRRHSTDKEWRQTDDEIAQTTLKASQNPTMAESLGQFHKPKCLYQKDISPSKREKVLQKQRSIVEQDDPLLSSQQAQEFLYIDEVPEASKMLATNSNEISQSIKGTLHMNDVSFDDLSDFGAAASQRDPPCIKLQKSVEMASKSRLKLLHGHRSIEEHAV